MSPYIPLAAFGAAGVISRYFIDQRLAGVGPGEFPLSTFLINAVGSLAIGAVYALSTERGLIGKETALYVTVGFLGGFTTFSAYALQTLLLVRHGHAATALTYFFASPPLAVLCAYFGFSLFK